MNLSKFSLQENQKQSTNYNELRCTFESLSCYLLPHPGPGVAENNDMDCTIGDMEIRSVFLEYIRSLFNDFLTEIPLKKMGEVEITGLSLFNIIEVPLFTFFSTNFLELLQQY